MRKVSKIYFSDLFLLGAIFVFLASLTWRKWGYPWIDYGIEVFAAWQVAAGKVLYRDLFYQYGPFSQYFQAAIFKVFGTSLTAFIFTNLAAVFLFVLLIYRYFLLAASRTAALMAALSFLLLFAFAQYVYNGNYNYVVPYVPEATHGLLWSLAALLSLSAWIFKPRSLYAMAAGLCAGFALLTKPEFAVALLVPSLFFPFFIINPLEKFPKHAALFTLFTVIPFLGFFLYFSFQMPFNEAAQAAGGAFDLHFARTYSRNVFFAAGSGMDNPFLNILRMMTSFLGLLTLFGVTAFLDVYFKNLNPRIRLCFAFLFCLAAGCLAFFLLNGAYRALPLITLTLCVFLLSELSHEWHAQKRRALASLLLWGLFSLGLLLKMLLFSRLHHYGFVLAMPAFVFTAACLMETVPARLRRNYGAGNFFRTTAAGLLFLLFFFNIFKSLAFYSQKEFQIGKEGDRFYAFPQEEDQAMVKVMEWLQANTPEDSTLAMIPQGQMINYQLRRSDPTRYPLFLFPAVLSEGEQVVLKNFQEARPDYIVIAPMNWSEYGVSYFGEKAGYGKSLIEWVTATYSKAASIPWGPEGTPPLEIYASRTGS